MTVSQCAVMLNYGEPQILELMKNTLPSRLYPFLFLIDNPRDAITTAKCAMIKEKIDRQKTNQSSATPFMRVNDCGQSTDKSGKRGVTFDVMETLERHSNSIDRLTSLVSKMNVKMDKKEVPYKSRVYQNRPRGNSRSRQQNYQPCNRSFSRDRNRPRGNYNYRNNRPNFRDRSRDSYRCDNKRNNYQSNERHDTYRQDNRRRDNYRQDNRNRQNYGGNNSRQRDRSESTDRLRNYNNNSSQGRERSRDRDGWMQPRSRTLSDDRGSRSRSNSRISTKRDRQRCYRCSEYDPFYTGVP